MKDIALKLLSELMKNCKKSDRELAAKLGVSQATVSRIRGRLEKDGIIQEYTLVPDFYKLGFEILALTLIRLKKDLSEEEIVKMRKFADEFLKKNPFAMVMAVQGTGLGYDNAVVSLHENYEAFTRFAKATKQVPLAEIADFQSFLVSLSGKHYQPFTLSTMKEKANR
jgi:DNA-binding Lrp family transcriptional regulator